MFDAKIKIGRVQVRITISLLFVCLLLIGSTQLHAQQKGQWVPGQFGLNAGVIPDPGFTYQNLALNYSANALNDANGNRLPGITGTYQFWVDENIFSVRPEIQIPRRLLRAVGLRQFGQRFLGCRHRGN